MGFKRNGWGFVFILLFAVLLLAGPAWAGSGRSETAEIVVRVLNHAGVGRIEMQNAEADAGRIFRAAGIDIQWVDCSKKDCHKAPEASEFVLNIVPDGHTSTDLVFGVAFLGPNGEGKYVDVFFRRIEATSVCSQQGISQMLGTVAAHELGHLLLGSHAHSGTGIMLASWDEETVHRAAMGSLLFTRGQGALMRARIGSGNGLLLATGAAGRE
jgi:hypothetical protein